MKNSQLINLPTELIVATFQDMHPLDMLQIAQTCRRLNCIVLPIYMERIGNPDPQKSCFVRPGKDGCLDQLTAINLNFPVLVLEKFICLMPHNLDPYVNNIGQSTRILTRNMKRIYYLISRLSSIGSIHIIVDVTWGSRWFQHPRVVCEFVVAVLQVVKMSMQKSCMAIHISLSPPPYMNKGYQFQLLTGSTKQRMQILRESLFDHLSFKKNARDAPKGDGWKYIKTFENNPILSPSILPEIPTKLNSRLTTIDLSPDIFFVPPVSNWTFELMKRSPITRLKLSLSSEISPDEFSLYVFPNVVKSVPRLEEIKLVSQRPECLLTVVRHLTSFSSLRKVTFGSMFDSAFFMPLLRVTNPSRLPPHLASFTGSLNQAIFLFDVPRLSCPDLRFINIILDTHYPNMVDYTDFANHFSTINHRFLQMGIEPCITVCLDNHQERLGLVYSDGGVNQQRTDQWAKALLTVSRLTLQLPFFYPIKHQEPTPSLLIEHTLSWLNLFRGVKNLSLIWKAPLDDDADARDRRRQTMLTSIQKQYPDVVTLNIVNLPSKPDKYHYHWSNARHDLERLADELPEMPFSQHKSYENCVCSDF